MSALIDKIINESRESGGTEYISKVNRLINDYESMGCTVDLYPGKFSSLNLSTIKVPPDRKNEGIGTKFMEELCAIADKFLITVTLTPSKDFRSNLERLKGFYRRFGFKPNTGRHADHRFSNSMIREPYGYDKIEEAFNI